jgi:hypothetical protein
MCFVKIYKNTYLVIFWLVNKYIGSGFLTKTSLAVFCLSKVAIVSYVLKIFNVNLHYSYIVFLLLLAFDLIFIMVETDYGRDNIEYHYDKLRKNNYIYIVFFYLLVSLICGIIVLKDI